MATDLHRPPGRTAAAYAGLTALAVVILFPVYMTVVRALSQPRAYVEAGQPPWPVDPEWNIFSRAFSSSTDSCPSCPTSASAGDYWASLRQQGRRPLRFGS